MGRRERQEFKAELTKLVEIGKRDREETDEFHEQNRRVAEAENRVDPLENIWVRLQVDLTGTKLHRALRNLAAEVTPNYEKRQERRRAFDIEFGNCTCGNGQPADKCDCWKGRS
ncbi:hypothetical protein K1T35_47665 (plasmid) [Pseudonocardia sp. DSM 110487]|uniref:hypothetical protein n=1 Tax=Pseudonocardia sp. DSM 110487 TaxID=2865833 RepID=UPI001C69C95E|nr:hypothetical protein [Pseudonocardia sp. DSM 110487]QYN41029.1 hypothetical protein K1T35_47665 [Pseudonocardia sp. DSM 110487]